MAHYAFVDSNNLVVRVITGRDEDDLPEGIDSWEDYYSSLEPGKRAIRTSYNTRGGIYYDPVTNEPGPDQSKAFRGNFASAGATYNPALDAFIPPKFYQSWVLDEATYSWVAPIPRPQDGKEYYWDESKTNWVEVVD